MDLIDTGTDPWIVEYDACEKVATEIMESLNLRDSEKISDQSYDALSAKIRIRLKQYESEVKELKRKLTLGSVISTLTIEERERRQRQVDSLLSKQLRLLEYFNQTSKKDNPNYIRDRSELLGNKTKLFDFTSSSSSKEHNDNDIRGINELKEEQEKLLKEQDEGLDTLLKIVTAQKKIASTINEEVEHHNEILVDIADGMERVDGRINRASDMVQIITKKENVWGYWLVAFLLFIAILGVAFA